MAHKIDQSAGTTDEDGGPEGVERIIPFDGVVIEIGKLPPKNCADCRYAYIGEGGVWCSYFSELIWDESEADRCEAYECR